MGYLSRIAIAVFLLTFAAAAEVRALLGPFIVTSTANSGPGSLSQAITDANTIPLGSTILFDLPGDGPHVIELTSALPRFQVDTQVINDRPGDETVTVRRSLNVGTPRFGIFGAWPDRTVLIAGLTISNGFSDGGGGGITNFSTMTVRNCTISGNDSLEVGGISNSNFSGSGAATLTLINCTVSGNGAGGVRNYGLPGQVATTSMTNCVISGNSNNQKGGGVSNSGFSLETTVTLTDCVVINNSGYPDGGGIANTMTLVLNNCTVAGNTAQGPFGFGSGGAISNPGAANLTITNSTLSGNGAGFGGAISMEDGTGTVAISNSTLSLNTATHEGGALYNFGGGVATITNCTISGNGLAGQGSGGAIHNEGTGHHLSRVDLINSTFAGNAAANGGAIRNVGSSSPQNTILTLVNTVLKTGQTGSNIVNDLGGLFTSFGHNLSSDAAGGDGGTNPGGLLVGPGDIRNTDPHLGPLASNGGPTETHALLPGSSAINGGDDGHAPNDDQRNSPRVQVSDIGSFEAQGVSPAVLGNISTRLRVAIDDNVLIGGFIVTGTQPKKVIVRAIGPSLSSFFPDALADPVLELRNSSGGLIASNDNWRSDQEGEIIATTIPPGNDLESAIVTTLAANGSAYTAIVRGANNGTGIGVVETYDLDRTVDSKLANISTRGLVGTGENVLIGGLIVLGQDPVRVILRASGPSLPVPGALGDPTLELRDGNGGLMASNDNWRSDQEAEIIATTLAPSNDQESALIRNLPPNNYTAIVRGVNLTTGIASVEAYALN